MLESAMDKAIALELSLKICELADVLKSKCHAPRCQKDPQSCPAFCKCSETRKVKLDLHTSILWTVAERLDMYAKKILNTKKLSYVGPIYDLVVSMRYVFGMHSKKYPNSCAIFSKLRDAFGMFFVDGDIYLTDRLLAQFDCYIQAVRRLKRGR